MHLDKPTTSLLDTMGLSIAQLPQTGALALVAIRREKERLLKRKLSLLETRMRKFGTSFNR